MVTGIAEPHIKHINKSEACDKFAPEREHRKVVAHFRGVHGLKRAEAP
jgi:hypothetical protein